MVGEEYRLRKQVKLFSDEENISFRRTAVSEDKNSLHIAYKSW